MGTPVEATLRQPAVQALESKRLCNFGLQGLGEGLAGDALHQLSNEPAVGQAVIALRGPGVWTGGEAASASTITRQSSICIASLIMLRMS